MGREIDMAAENFDPATCCGCICARCAGGHNIGVGALRPLDCGRFNLVNFQEGDRTSLGEIRAIPEEEDEGVLPELLRA